MVVAEPTIAQAVRVALGLVWLVSAALAGGQTAPEVLANYESVKLVGVLRQGGPRFDLYVDCVPFHESGKRLDPPRQAGFLGTDGQDPSCVVGSFVLKLDGAETQIPARSYNDLADVALPRGIYITKRGPLVIVHVQGGDGAGLYKARFLFRRGRLVSREVQQLNESGEPAVKRTNY